MTDDMHVAFTFMYFAMIPPHRMDGFDELYKPLVRDCCAQPRGWFAETTLPRELTTDRLYAQTHYTSHFDELI